MDAEKRGLQIFVVVLIAAAIVGVTGFPFYTFESITGLVTGTGDVGIQNLAPFSTTIPNQTIAENSNVTIDLSQFFTDPEKNTLNFTSTFPPNVTVIINENSPLVTIIPDTNFTGTRNISFSAFDLISTNSSNLVSLFIGQAGWINVTAPEGVFEPENTSLVGTHVETFGMKFTGLTIAANQDLACDVKVANGSIYSVQETGLTFGNVNYSLNYTVNAIDSIINDPLVGYLPWVVKNCTLKESGTTLFSQDLSDRIYLHNPQYWEDSEITRAVTCQGTPGVFFNNTARCEFSEDTIFSLQMRNGNPTNESCYNNKGVACEDSLCRTIHFPSCDALSYFPSFSADTEDPNNFASFTETVGGVSTPVQYTFFTNSSGTFKLRLTPTLTNKAFSFTIYNLTNVTSTGTNVYGAEQGNGTLKVTDQGDGTYTVAYFNFGSFTGSLDFVMNISFDDPAIVDNRTLQLVIAYGTDTNQGAPPSFNASFDPVIGLYNYNESQSTSFTTDTGGVCGDEANNDFDYIGGTFANSYDCFDRDCNGVQGDDSQTNEFGSGQTGLCNYQFETNCSDFFDNDYDNVAGTGFTDCHDTECFQNNTYCPAIELICDDGINNDWDYTLGNSDLASDEKILNNGTKYNSTYQSNITDCEDGDCNGVVGGPLGQLCNWGFETNCSDSFDNDALQLQDCQLSSVGSSTSSVTPAFGEYDCSQYCRATNTSAETGGLCDDNVDNDWDAVTISGFFTDTYSANTSENSGIDCRWGGYFGIGTDYNPDESCNATILSTGNVCNLAQEQNCTDGFDNDFDSDASGMPSPNWTANTTDYLLEFGVAYATDADHDDYDCAATSPINESKNAYWCFDGIDNDLDAYIFNGTGYALNSSNGVDCADPDCLGVTNPNNANQTCLTQEFNATDPFFGNLTFPGLYCSNDVDDDADGPKDCADLDCFKQFDSCSLGPCYNVENLTWNACADSSNNDFADGVDCADITDCVGMLGDTTGPLCETAESSCSDGFDNDADGSADCSDAGCVGSTGGVINNVSISCSTESSATACFDGFDNDDDGNVDCMDTGCNTACTLSSISGTTPISLPTQSGSISLNSVSTATVAQSTTRIRKGSIYNVSMKMTGSSSDAQWTLGTALGGRFNKSSFDTGSAALSGPDSASFTLTETANGFIIDSNGASLPSGYRVDFTITSDELLSSVTYELTYAESTGSQTSLNNDITHEVVENVAPVVNSFQVVPNNTLVEFGGSVSIRANISDNNALGECEFDISGPATFTPSDSTTCRASFSPTLEGTYTINVTAVDYYSNRKSSIDTHVVNILPTGNTTTTDERFYNSTEADSIVFNASFNVASTDTLGSCQIFAENDSTLQLLTTVSASGNSCSASISTTGINDGLYTLFARVTETTDSNLVDSATKAVFICSQVENGICQFTDFDSDGFADVCGITNVTAPVTPAPAPEPGAIGPGTGPISPTPIIIPPMDIVQPVIEPVRTCFPRPFFIDDELDKIGRSSILLTNLYECNTFYFGKYGVQQQLSYLLIDEISVVNNEITVSLFDAEGNRVQYFLSPSQQLNVDVDNNGIDDYQVIFDSFTGQYAVNIAFKKLKRSVFVTATQTLPLTVLLILILLLIMIIILFGIFYLSRRREND